MICQIYTSQFSKKNQSSSVTPIGNISNLASYALTHRTDRPYALGFSRSPPVAGGHKAIDLVVAFITRPRQIQLTDAQVHHEVEP